MTFSSWVTMSTGLSEKWFQRQKRELAADAPEVVITNSEDRISRYLKGERSGPRAAAGAVSALDCLWRHHARRAAGRVRDGDSNSYAVIDQSLLTAGAVVLAQARAVELDPSPGYAACSMDQSGLAWLHAESVGARQVADAVASRIRRFVAGERFWDIPSLPPSTLVAHWLTGKPLDELVAEKWPMLGGFRAARKSALSPADFDELASLHCERAPRDVSFFDRSPLFLMPIELLVLEKRTGCRMEGRHPIINSPLAARRVVPNIKPHPQIAEVLQRAASDLPGLEQLIVE